VGTRRVVLVGFLLLVARCTCFNYSTPPPPDCADLRTVPNGQFELTDEGCGGGTCQLVCNIGFVDCDNNTTNGCETSSTSAPHTQLVPNGTGSCSVTCDFGWHVCPGGNVDAGCDCQPPEMETGTNDDASSCASSTVDGGSGDAGFFGWEPPSTPTSACTADQLNDYYNDCYGSDASTSSCDSWSSTNEGCASCLLSNEGEAGTYGPIVQLGDGWVYANVGGCIALVSGDTSPTGCGAAYWAAQSCEDIACASCSQDPDEYLGCLQVAAGAVCLPYANATCDISPDAGADAAAIYDTCENQTTFQGYVTTLGALFCGAADDGGTDASVDALSE
jgi:hypothetical protein